MSPKSVIIGDMVRAPRRRAAVVALALLLSAGAWVFVTHGRSIWVPWTQRLGGRRTVDDVMRSLDAGPGQRIRDAFAAGGARVAGTRLWLLAVKDERRLELWAEGPRGGRVRVRSWQVLAASGGPGPKLREGDRQVPEGVYAIDQLNPNSAYHLSLRVSYPNAFDRAHATTDGRTGLGGDIFIHGKDVSVGCLAIGDDGIEELFWLAATTGKDAFTVVIVPTDLRRRSPPSVTAAPPWVAELYGTLLAELAAFVEK